MAADALVMSDGEYDSDSSDAGVEEESAPISLEYKKSKLFQQREAPEPKTKQNAPGKLKNWQPVSTRYLGSGMTCEG